MKLKIKVIVSVFLLLFSLKANENYGLILSQLLEKKSFFKKEIEDRLDKVETFSIAIYDIYSLMHAGEIDDPALNHLIKKAGRKASSIKFAQFKEKIDQLEADYKLIKGKEIKKASFEAYPDFELFMNNIDKEIKSGVGLPNVFVDLFLILEHESVLNPEEVGRQSRELVYKKLKNVQQVATSNKEMEIYKPYVLEIVDKCLNMKYYDDLVWREEALRDKLKKLKIITEEKSKFKIEAEGPSKLQKKEVYQPSTAKKITQVEPKKESVVNSGAKKIKKSSQNTKVKKPVKKRSESEGSKPKKEKVKKEPSAAKPKKTNSKKKNEKKPEPLDTPGAQGVKPKPSKVSAGRKNKLSLEKTKINAKINKKRKRSEES